MAWVNATSRAHAASAVLEQRKDRAKFKFGDVDDVSKFEKKLTLDLKLAQLATGVTVTPGWRRLYSSTIDEKTLLSLSRFLTEANVMFPETGYQKNTPNVEQRAFSNATLVLLYMKVVQRSALLDTNIVHRSIFPNCRPAHSVRISFVCPPLLDLQLSLSVSSVLPASFSPLIHIC